MRSSVLRNFLDAEKSFSAQKLQDPNGTCLSSKCWEQDGSKKYQFFEDANLKLKQAFRSGTLILSWLLKIDAELNKT
jgi:hypothetical protein